MTDIERAMITSLAAQRHAESGRRGIVLSVRWPNSDLSMVYYLTDEELSALLRMASETEPEREAFALLIDGASVRTEVIPRDTAH